jgi:hypothetical protein
MKQKVGSLEKIKIDKALAKLTKRRLELIKSDLKKGNITTHSNEIQIIQEFFENLYFNNLKN